MNFQNYINRQKNQINRRHFGEELFVQKVHAYRVQPLRSSDEIMQSLKNSKGLNTAERAAQNAERLYTYSRNFVA